MAKNEAWFDNEEAGVSICVSLEGRNPKVQFYDYEAVEKAKEGEDASLENGDRLAPSLSPSSEDFYTNPWWISKIKKTLRNSPNTDLEDDVVGDLVSSFSMAAEDAIPNLVEAKKSGGDDEDQSMKNMNVDEDWAEEKAEEWLSSPDLLSKVDRVIHHHLAGETKNALMVFLSMISTKTQEPNTLRPTGESSIGKSLPEGETVSVLNSSLSTPIEEVEAPNKSPQSDGIKGVRNVAEFDHDGKILEITTRSGRTVTCTPDHSLLTWDEGLNSMPASEVEEGTLMPLTGGITPSGEKTEIESWKYEMGGNHDKINVTFDLDYSFGFLVGIYLAEGCTRPTQVAISCFNDELKETVKGFAEEHSINSYKTPDGTEIRLYSTTFTNLMEEEFGRTDSKDIPGWVLESPQEFIDGILDGYMSGDADTFTGSFTSQCKSLRDGIVQLLLTKGVTCGLKEREIDGKTYYRANMCRHEHESWPKLYHKDWKYSPSDPPADRFTAYPFEFFELLSEENQLYKRGSETRKWSGTHNRRCRENGWVSRHFLLELMKHCDNVPDELDMVRDRSMYFDPVVEINEKEYSGKVYDLETETGNFLTSEGLLVHNSFLVTRVAKLLPEEMKIVRKGFSEMAVWNKAKPLKGSEDRRVWHLTDKVLVLLEEETAEEFLEQFRPVLSHDEKRITYEVTNTESQSRDTLKIDIVGWPAYIGMRVGSQMDDQEETRAMKMTPDSGKEKYGTAVWWNARKKETPWLKQIRESETGVMKKAVSMLDRYNVIMPFREEIQKHFPTERRRHMRDWNQFSALVEAMTVLHQEQRPIIEIDGEEYLVAHPDDVKAVVMTAKDALAETLMNMDARMRKYWREIHDSGPVSGYSGLVDTYEECFGEKAGKSTIREKYIEPLVDMDMINVKEGKGSRPNRFTATGKLSTLSPKLDKMVKSAYNFDFENSTFSLLSSSKTGPVNTPLLRGCGELVESNPYSAEDMDDFKTFWGNYLEIPSIVEENKELLETEYEDDYEYGGRYSPDEDGEGEDGTQTEIEPLNGEETEIEPLQELSQDELVSKLHNLYQEMNIQEGEDSLDYPHLVDFAEVAADRYETSKRRVIEMGKRLENEGDLVFDKGGMDEVDDGDEEN